MRRLCQLVLACLTLLASPMPGFAEAFKVTSTEGVVDVYKTNKALLVGISKYKTWPILSPIPAEIDNLRNALLRQGFAASDITVVLNPNVHQLHDSVKAFMLQSVDASTRLFLYAAGHGYTDRRSTGYLVPADAPLESAADFRATLLGMDDISNWSEASPAKHIMMIFDSCFSGAVFLTKGAANLPSPLFLNDADQPVRQFITSGSEFDEVPAQSRFAEELVKGLDGEADTYQDGIVTGLELGYWLKAKITPFKIQTPQYGTSIKPAFRRGDVLFRAVNAQPLFASAAGVRRIPVSATVARPAGGTRGPTSQPADTAPLPANAGAGGPLFDKVEILYYAKTSDKATVQDALDAESIPYLRTRAIKLPDQFEVNAVACGKDVPIDAVKKVALALTQHGVAVRAIFPFRDPVAKRRRIELVSLSDNAERITSLSTAPLTVAQISGIRSCTWLQNKKT
jgi:hypothetical protein